MVPLHAAPQSLHTILSVPQVLDEVTEVVASVWCDYPCLVQCSMRAVGAPATSHGSPASLRQAGQS